MNYIEQKYQRKKKITKTRETFDSITTIHKEKMEYFKEIKTITIPNKKNEIEIYNLLIDKNKNSIKDVINNISKIKDLEKEVLLLSQEENDYFLNTAPILSDYFILEDAPETIENNEKKKQLLYDYYQILGLSIPKNLSSNKTHSNYSREYDCENCKGINCMITDNECHSCDICGYVSRNIFLAATLSFKESQENVFVDKVAYKRINYFKECLNQIQAKGHNDIPQEILDKINIELEKEKFENMSKFTNKICRNILKKIGHSKYYEHIPSIVYILNGLPPLCVPKHIEDILIYIFQELQSPYEKFKPSDRKSFFSVNYIFYKMFELLDLPEYLPFFPLLDSRLKLYKQDITFGKVMEYLRDNPPKNCPYDIEWRFKRSV